MGIVANTWNCNKGLIDGKGTATAKLSTIHHFLLAHNVDLLAIIEANIHGLRSNVIRVTLLTNEAAHRELAIPGYKIIFPTSWARHDTARIMLYARTNISVQVLHTRAQLADLPVISVTARRGAEVKTAYTFMYREYTGVYWG